MLMHTDPFREFDRLTQQVFAGTGTWSRPSSMPADAYREGEDHVLALDLPGVSPDAIDIDVEQNVLTVRAERRPTASDDVRMEISERPLGVFSRRFLLADSLDTDRITADYDAGVLTVRIPVTERSKPCKIPIGQRARRAIGR
ncbi:Hsp20/alpha crystallin family protein [Streptomyces radicis]|uniref:Hsp20/alpha crystallin family protein n=1 Tax=Streptomyces radicis TaxID=1750517 RepID=A0A3A9WY32_9ACTN|nr:Hsp20/alpha crystallin family protein [Streptomyces radicis]RKN11087.1 Hsp20/alpha crystallin family protein [Streptomyces radicis]RKN25406.1 Hsp20/alpha crystallin family protein [Streptomyces radicis]